VNWQQVALKSIAPMSWRNGGGSTRELFAWPSTTDWTWRISVAEVEADGPFSHFPGVQRHLAILRGSGLALHRASGDLTLLHTNQPICFDGEETIAATLPHGPVQDINLMVRRGSAVAHMRRIVSAHSAQIDADKLVAIYAQDALCIVTQARCIPVAAETLAICNMPKGSAIAIAADSAPPRAIWMEITALKCLEIPLQRLPLAPACSP
jgi:uncharacterized protein